MLDFKRQPLSRRLLRAVAMAAVTLIAAISVTSCHSHRQNVAPGYTSGSGSSSAISENVAVAVSRADASTQWTRLKVPVKVSGLGIPLSGTAWMERGRAVYVSMKVLGMEVAWGMVTPDSIVVVDKVHGQYLAEPMSAVTSRMPLTLANIQDLLLGVPFVFGSKSLADAPRKSLDATRGAQGGWTLTPSPVAGCDYRFVFDDSSVLQSVEATVPGGREVSVVYTGGWDTTPCGDFPRQTDGRLPVSGKTLSASLKWNFGKAQWNADVTIPSPRIPQGARRLNASDLLRMLQSF